MHLSHFCVASSIFEIKLWFGPIQSIQNDHTRVSVALSFMVTLPKVKQRSETVVHWHPHAILVFHFFVVDCD